MVEVSNPDKVIFPEPGYTKADLVDHYRRVAPAMVPHMTGRPLTLHRFPSGVAAKGFMQKNAADYFPASIRRVEVPKRDGGTTTYPVVDEADDLSYLANQGTITFHAWTSRLPDLDHPDRIVFDLDPEPGDVDAARRAAGLLRAYLDDLELPTAPMTTGSNGYHLVTAIATDVHFGDAAGFARTAATVVAELHRDVLTHEFRKDKREGRVFVDWLRNQQGATGVVPWSLRPKPEAPVAVPFEWDELAGTPPRRWTLATVGDRLGIDPIAALAPVDLGPAMAAVATQAEELGIELEPFDRFRS